MSGQFRYALPKDMDPVVPIPSPVTSKRLNRFSARGIVGRKPPDFIRMAERKAIKADSPFVPISVSLIPGGGRPGYIRQLSRNEDAICFPKSAVSPSAIR